MKKLLLMAAMAVCSIAAQAQFSFGDITNSTSCQVEVYVYDHPIADCSWVSGPPPSTPPTFSVILPPAPSPTTPSWAGSNPGDPIMIPALAPGMERSYYVLIDNNCWYGPISLTSTCPGETNALFPDPNLCEFSCHIGEIWAHPNGFLWIV